MEFMDNDESELGERFLADGHIVLPVDDTSGLERLRNLIAGLAATHFGLPAPEESGAFLETIHDRLPPEELNEFRLYVINSMNAEAWLRPTYYGLARKALAAVVGNELVMQKRINLSIQLPNDDGSLLPVHADVWSGDSPFEVVVWLPLVDCQATKSMYLLAPAPNATMHTRMKEFASNSPEDLFKAIEDQVEFIKISFGQILVFSQNLMHGNRINQEAETRWSMNCRFKSLFSPYADKKLGEFFEPITLKPATRMGLDYDPPQGFDD
jgi:sporadic carbohydrate cluster 2OG-Fe(II) oxygenase